VTFKLTKAGRTTSGKADMVSTARCVCVATVLAYALAVALPVAAFAQGAASALSVEEIASKRLADGAVAQDGGQCRDAIRHFDEVIRMVRGTPVDHLKVLAHYNAGRCYEKLAEPASALRHYREAARLAPQSVIGQSSISRAAALTPPPAVTAAPCKRQAYIVFFDETGAFAAAAVQTIAQILRVNATCSVGGVQVTGNAHPKEFTTSLSPLALAQARAATVRARLVAGGIPASKISARGGVGALLDDDAIEPQSRRVEIEVR